MSPVDRAAVIAEEQRAVDHAYDCRAIGLRSSVAEPNRSRSTDVAPVAVVQVAVPARPDDRHEGWVARCGGGMWKRGARPWRVRVTCPELDQWEGGFFAPTPSTKSL